MKSTTFLQTIESGYREPKISVSSRQRMPSTTASGMRTRASSVSANLTLMMIKAGNINVPNPQTHDP